ncbi:acyl-CoA synthetase [Dictyobacter sp. S3.2.2.5]|uniref:Acyl-CoA synthetase n=1 Tax=Dictyobacter halimunensis TaxID=3026934 RepID=A0ABQ6FH56_9CHLR|nr:acyl-CoA synthetase [Dictyobacter sp. S3.2.2.5]
MTHHIQNLTSGVRTFIDVLSWRARHQYEQTGYTFLLDGEREEVHLTYGDLDLRARAIAARLQRLGATGKRALLLFPAGLDYITTFFGCIYAGVVAIPAYPPRPNRQDRTLTRLQTIVANARPQFALTTTLLLSEVDALFKYAPEFRRMCWLSTEDLPCELANEWQRPAVESQNLAFLQYTSGSTNDPKGVMLSHGNLLHNAALIEQGMEHTAESRGVMWLPPYHDMGLLGGVLQPLYAGRLMTLLSPAAFAQRPVRWLEAISRTRATNSGGPNFAYELCARKITPEQRANLDLSNWSVAFVGAEPIQLVSLQKFAETFKSCGFRWEAFYPCYGLAEATLIVSGGLKAAAPVLHTVTKAALELNTIMTATADEEGETLVGCGRTLGDQSINIVDPTTLIPCQSDKVGEIWVSGPSIATGYWQQPEETKATFHAYLTTGEGPFLRTGDLGYLHNGELFVTGRLKDLIIIRGRNVYPHDIEQAVERSHVLLRAGCSAAFSITIAGEERLIIAQEVERAFQRSDASAIVSAIRQAVWKEYALQVHAVSLLRPGSIPKTSSGKTQRHLCRKKYLAGSLETVGASHVGI